IPRPGLRRLWRYRVETIDGCYLFLDAPCIPGELGGRNARAALDRNPTRMPRPPEAGSPNDDVGQAQRHLAANHVDDFGAERIHAGCDWSAKVRPLVLQLDDL